MQLHEGFMDGSISFASHLHHNNLPQDRDCSRLYCSCIY